MYIDTSSFVQLYFAEEGSENSERTVIGQTLVSSQLLYCEFRSALMGKRSRGIISGETGAEIWNHFLARVRSLEIELVPVESELVREAAELLSELHPVIPLRTLDALHLATYLSMDAGPFFTKDQRLLAAARHLGLETAA